MSAIKIMSDTIAAELPLLTEMPQNRTSRMMCKPYYDMHTGSPESTLDAWMRLKNVRENAVGGDTSESFQLFTDSSWGIPHNLLG
jgi:hypothetical protein